jgi:hypothetical protein
MWLGKFSPIKSFLHKVASLIIEGVSFKHKKARNVNCGLFRHCRRVYLVSLATYLVELGGFEPPSEITTPSALHA